MAYQSFDGEKGDSDSSAKLACLKLPDDLGGKTLLDIGCNEGFFVREALRRGASRAVGIDMSSDLIAKARKRTPEGVFETMSWWDIGSEKFDYILFLSAIHYEKEQRRLLTKLSYNLKPGGTLILECGLIGGNKSLEWKLIDRHDGVFRFPTYGYIENTLLSAYSSRIVGRSVTQAGDPLGRYVIHCQVLEPRIFVVSGWSRSGKSTFCQSMARQGVRVINSDLVMTNAFQEMKASKDPFISYMVKTMELNSIDIFAKKIVEDQKIDQFCRFMMRFISKDDEITIVEGFPFVFPEVLDSFKKIVGQEGFLFASTRFEGGVESKFG